MTKGERIKYHRERKGFSQAEFARIVGISKQSLYKYENNIVTNIPSNIIEIIAEKLDISPSTIMGWDDASSILLLPNENYYQIPLYDSVAAGFGAFADNTILGYIPTYLSSPSEKDLFLWINVQGDSMSPLIDDGSKVLVRKQDSVDSNQIAVVLIDGEEAVVKKIKYGKDWIELISVNPYYPPRRFEGADVQRIRVIGLVKEVSKSLQ